MEFVRTKKALPSRIFRPSGFVRTVKAKPVPREQEETHPLIDYWNTLPGLTKHRPGTGVYHESSKLLDKLRTVGFGDLQWDQEWIVQAKINRRFLSTPWTDLTITNTMDIISQMVQPGYYPGPDSYIVKRSLNQLLYSRVLKSTFMHARSQMIARMTKEHLSQIAKENISSEGQDLLDIFSQYSIKILPNTAQKLVNLYNNIMTENGRYYNHLYPTHKAFSETLAHWLLIHNYSNPGQSILPPDGWMLKRFMKEHFEE